MIQKLGRHPYLCTRHPTQKALVTAGAEAADSTALQVPASGAAPTALTFLPARHAGWDLNPSSSDPTGTHVDYMGLPAGPWTMRIYTVAGDLVQQIRSTDAVNRSIRRPVQVGNATYPGFNRQQDNPNDGQASWNLISRNGQDIASGIYLFTVESSEGSQRGKFV